MSVKKTIFIIPGYRHKPTGKAYKEIATFLKTEGYTPILVHINWKQTTISQNTEYFLKQYKKIQRKKKYILGFSFGAMIAFLASTKVEVSGLILCSLSPYFTEDLQKVSDNPRYRDFTKLHCAALAKQIKAEQILMLYGSREEKSLIRRVRQAFADIESSQKYLLPVKATDHTIGNRRYLQTIHLAAKVMQ